MSRLLGFPGYLPLFQWATSLGGHDPSPPIAIESSPGYANPLWDLPPRRASQSGIYHIGQSLLLTTLAVVGAVTYVPREPLVTRPVAQRVVQQDQAQNLLLTTLAPAAIPRNVEADGYRVPQLRRYPVAQDQVPNLLGTTLAPTVSVAVIPRPPYQIQQFPQRRAQQPSYPGRLRDTSVVAPSGTPFAQLDWAVPRSLIKGLSPSQTLDTVTLKDPELPTGRQQDFPNPSLGARRGLQPYEPSRIRDTTVIVAPDLPPGRLQDWPTSKKLFQGLHPSQVLDTVTLIEGFPVGRLLDWPNPPLGAKRAYQEGIRDSSLVNLTYVPPVIPPGRLMDWPNPRGYTQAFQDGTKNSSLINLTYVPPVNVPRTWIGRGSTVGTGMRVFISD